MPEIVITTLAERPEVTPYLGDFWGVWPRFMLNDLIADALLWRVTEEFADQCLIATEDGELVAHARSIGFCFRVRGSDGAAGWRVGSGDAVGCDDLDRGRVQRSSGSRRGRW
ncbi:hypothetical protein [Kribbella sp. NPDC051770]|uniref:hypothetical protein n=1 Tax=Kribbella sp. NPDC051770 TaxID=3155413 RepID=UPI003416570C